MTSKTSVTATGRISGYTDEIDAVERQVNRALVKSSVTFKVTDRKVIGSRGWFTRRLISKYEYEITGPTRDEVFEMGDIITMMAREMLS